MSSNSKIAKGTFRGRLVLLYVLLFMLTQIICVLILYLCQRHSVFSNIRRKIDIFTNEFTYEYMVGEEFTHAKRPHSLGKVPASLMSAARRAIPGFDAHLYFTGVEDGTHSLLGAAAGEVFEFRATLEGIDRGIVISHQVEDRVVLINSEFNEESYGEDVEHIFFLLLSPTGELLAKSGFSEAGTARFIDHRPFNGRRHATFRLPNTRIMARYSRLFDDNILVIAQDTRQLGRYMTNLLYTILFTLVFSLAISIYAGRWIATRFVASIRRVTNAARAIGAGQYKQRVAYGGEGVEINELVDAFNKMTAKTENLLNELKAISESLAHDLRTPLTRMQAQAELAMEGQEVDSLASGIAEECSGLLTMINNMMSIVALESETVVAPCDDIDVIAVAREVLDLFATVAEDKRVKLEDRLPDQPLVIPFDRTKLQRLLANLLDNAIKFTPESGTVTTTVNVDDHGVTIEVSDTGCGISESELPHIFERFYRADDSRNIPGNGLGLSLAKAVVESCKGEIFVDSVVGQGSTFTVQLPNHRIWDA